MYNDKYNAPDTYTDMDGQSKNFTHINYSKKSKMSFQMKEEQDLQEQLKNSKKELQDRILAIPAVMYPEPFMDFILRGENYEVVSWNEPMIRDEGTPYNTLYNLWVLTDNKYDFYGRKNPYQK